MPIQFINKRPASGGSGAGDFFNGLEFDLIENKAGLGGTLAKDTVIDVNNFALQLYNSAGSNAQLIIDPQGNLTGRVQANFTLSGLGLYQGEDGFTGDQWSVLNNVGNFPGSSIQIGISFTGSVSYGISLFGYNSSGEFGLHRYSAGSDTFLLKIDTNSGGLSWNGGDFFEVGGLATGTVALDTTQYINIKLNGTAYKLALVN